MTGPSGRGPADRAGAGAARGDSDPRPRTSAIELQGHSRFPGSACPGRPAGAVSLKAGWQNGM